MGKLLPLTVFLFATGGALYLASHCGLLGLSGPPLDIQSYRQDGWFGRSLAPDEAIPVDSTEIRPFTISIPQADLADLKTRLGRSRFVDHLPDSGFTYGFNSEYLKTVIKYWTTKYDWRKEEATLNAVPQFKTTIEGLELHFIRVRPSAPAKKVIPLLVIHGWPGSVLEYYKSFPLLTQADENGIAFEVIAPSIPGYGFSEAPKQKGFDATAAARLFTKLMVRLGHEKFIVHGGDWGYLISKMLAIIYPEHTLGVHLLGNILGTPVNALHFGKIALAALTPSLLFGTEKATYEYEKFFPVGQKAAFLLAETGYFHLQATKPDTIGAALVDSPVGLAAYILEKFSTWTNRAGREADDGALTSKFTLDELLTNVMLYWSSGNIAASQRFYKENVPHFLEWSSLVITVPAATVDVPHEFVRSPRALIEPYFEALLQYTDLGVGGHFTAFEEPHLVAQDIHSFAGKLLALQKKPVVKEEM